MKGIWLRIKNQSTESVDKHKKGVCAVKRLHVLGLAVFVALIVSVVAAAAAPNLEIVIPKATKAPVIDGKLNDAAWLNASIKGGKAVVDVDNNGVILSQYPRVAYLTYDDKALYVAFAIFAPDVTKLESSLPAWSHNDEIEVFLQPFKVGDHFQFGVTANGTQGGRGTGAQAAVSTAGIRWVVEMAIPWDSVGGKAPKAGDKWGLNLCGRQIAVGDQWLAWNCTFGGFHNPAAFGTAIFGE
jgi:hypothetical protein